MQLPHVSCKWVELHRHKDHITKTIEHTDNSKRDQKMEYEFGWNDPPSSAYSAASSQDASSKLTHLPRRHPPADAITTTSTPSTAAAPPPSLAAPPTSTMPIHLRVGGSKNTSDSKISEEGKSKDNFKYNETDFTEIIDKLNCMTDNLQEKLQKKVYDDIKRRLNLLTVQLKNDKISPAVRLKTGQLVAAMEDKDFETADSLQVGLMVDHVSEVSQWLVGVKKLIFTLRSES